MCENVQRNPADRIKWTQQVERLGRAKPENGFFARHDHKRLQTQKTQRSNSLRGQHRTWPAAATVAATIVATVAANDCHSRQLVDG